MSTSTRCAARTSTAHLFAHAAQVAAPRRAVPRRLSCGSSDTLRLQPCDKPLTVAIEAQDFEFEDTDTSSGGIVAEITWCGSTILTGAKRAWTDPKTYSDPDNSRVHEWSCSKSAPELWMMPCAAGGSCGVNNGSFHAGDPPPSPKFHDVR
jgi:hypothetical protein